MKAANFDYELAQSLEHALELLDTCQSDVKLIAGGQSLVPMMAMRLAKPGRLIDINRISALKKLESTSNHLITGALLCQSTLEHSSEKSKVPLIVQAITWIGHQQTRNRGTIGGSLAHADPSAELPLISVILNADIYIANKQNGIRHIKARDFFLGPMWTILQANDCLTEIHWPIWTGNYIGSSFMETSIRHGDFAMASAGVQLQLNTAKEITRIELGLGGMGGTPLVFPDISQQLVGKTLTLELALEISMSCVERTEPSSDLHANERYRKHLARTLLSRSLLEAYSTAKSNHHE